MADLLKTELGIEAELQQGKPGEFTVLVNDEVIAKKGFLMLPSDQKIIAAVRQALDGGVPTGGAPAIE
ncbi:MAG: hypothetical protein MUP73_02280 [Dehalococcoidia bacterium]|nr:hypothetical protein [Dehalococcoidia bacterium]